MSDPTPISHIALEVDTSAEQLAAAHADYVVEDFLGRLCLPRQIAREIIVEHRERLRVHAEHLAERRQRSSAAARVAHEDMRARLAARAERDAAMLAADPSMPAAVLMMSADIEREMTRTGERNDEMRRGISRGATFGRRGK